MSIYIHGALRVEQYVPEVASPRMMNIRIQLSAKELYESSIHEAGLLGLTRA